MKTCEFEFQGFPKIPRYSRECIISEKIDGTNGQIYINPEVTVLFNGKPLPFLIGSRERWITPDQDNHGFANWALKNQEELLKLGPGRHFGEWWGQGIQRSYGLKEKRFSLFNVLRWDIEMFYLFKWHPWKDRGDDTPEPVFVPPPACCNTVPVFGGGMFGTGIIESALAELQLHGSFAAPGFMNPEGIVIFHKAGNFLFKKTIKNDVGGKGE